MNRAAILTETKTNHQVLLVSEPAPAVGRAYVCPCGQAIVVDHVYECQTTEWTTRCMVKVESITDNRRTS